ncbi:MAG: F0F1 ATP synthase subunit gamma [Arsenophonus sp. ER-LPS3-MAG3]
MIASKDIYLKINSLQNIQKITKSMEMVSISKMRKTQERMVASHPYIKSMSNIINHITSGNLEYKHSYLKQRDAKRVGYLIISTDRGLCGSLNINLFKQLLIEIKIWTDKNVKIDLALIGSKAILFFNSIGGNIIAQISGIGDNPSISNIIGPVKIMLKAYNEERLDKLYLVTNKFINTMMQIPTITQLLPLSLDDKKIFKKKSWDYLYEPDPKIVLDTILNRYIESQVYQSVVENLASEQAARMIAMKTATDNSSCLIKELKLVYNKARQDNITQELAEIISGTIPI